MEKTVRLKFPKGKPVIVKKQGYMLTFKFESGNHGPLFWCTDKKLVPFYKNADGTTEWFPLQAAKKFANHFGVKLQTQ